MDKYIIALVGNEVVHYIPIPFNPDNPDGQERMIAAYTSNPTFVIHDKPVHLSWTYDGSEFNRPIGWTYDGSGLNGPA